MSYVKLGHHGCLCANCDRALPAIPIRYYDEAPRTRPYTVRRTCQCCGLINLIDVDPHARGDDQFKYRKGGWKNAQI